MILKFKKTIYDPLFIVTNDHEGLGNDDFWVNIDFKLKNEDTSFNGIIPGMSFKELKKWYQMNERFLEGKMKSNEVLTFIKRIGEIHYFPKKDMVEKRLFLYKDLDKYYSIYFDKEELAEINKNNKEFIDSIENR